MLTILFVMLAEILIFIPSFSRQRIDYLEMQMQRAEIAIQALLVSVGSMPKMNDIPPEKEIDLLSAMGLYEIVKYDANDDVIVRLKRPLTQYSFEKYDLSHNDPLQWIVDSFKSSFNNSAELIRLTKTNPIDQTRLVVVLPKAELKQSLLGYAIRILLLSLFISGVTALLIYMVIKRFVVRPIVNLIEKMEYYQKEPEDPKRIIAPSSSIKDINAAETALATLQSQVIEALDQKNRLAALGEAVAKINHDLRNILASAQLLADRLEQSQEPMAQRIGQKLVRSLDRATTLCTNSLIYGRLKETLPQKKPVNLSDVVTDVLESILWKDADLDIQVNIDHPISFMSDADYLYRILLNLLRNSYQAIERHADSSKLLIINAKIEGKFVVIHISDTGDGIPDDMLDVLYKPFKGNVRQGGSGLGLPITQDLCKVLGGEITLLKTNDKGTVFEVKLPYEAVPSKEKNTNIKLFDEIL